jgi:hypothetical protein
MLTKLLTRFPAYTVVEKPTSKVVARYRDQVPADLLELWEQYGFGIFGDGYLRIVNPADYVELVADTYQLTSTPSDGPPLALFATAMGDLLIWEMAYLSLVDYRHGNVTIVGKSLKNFFRVFAEDSYLVERLRWEPYPAARERLGEPAFDECFGYVPALALGGPETADHLQKVKLREHIYLLSQFTGRLER